MVLTFNQRERTVRCLRSLQRLEGPPFDTLLWDNGSTDGTEDAISAEFPDALVHRHSENLGVASGRNAAAKTAIESFDPSHLLFLDNDMLVEPGFVEALLRPFESRAKLGQTQAKLLFLKDRNRLNDGGGCRISFWLARTTPVGYGEIDRGQRDTPARCIACGGAMMVRRDIFEELNGFDPTFDPFGPEDLDFSLRLQKAGYEALYIPQAVAFHAVSHSFAGGEFSEVYARHKAQHWLKFLRRHATPLQQLGFYLVGLPLAASRVLIREGRRGNLSSLRGLARGLLDSVRKS